MKGLAMEDKYLRIAYQLESELRRMRAAGITKLASEESLCADFSCSRQTIRAALNILVDKGLIVKKRGSGSYIADIASKLQDTVVFITGDKFEYEKPEFISQLKEYLKKKKYDLICYSTDHSFSKEHEALNKVLENTPAAVLIEPTADVIPNPNIELIDKISKKGIPVVYLYSSYSEPSNAMCIKEDDLNGAVKLVSHLKEYGHKKTCCIFRCDDSRGLTRYKGYIEACKEYGLAFDEHSSFFFTSRDRKKLIKGDDDMLQRFIKEMDPECSAVVCHNDEIAFRLIKSLEKCGRSVPKDIAVVSFENSYFPKDPVGITSLGHSEKELTKTAADTLLSAIDHKLIRTEPVRWNLHVRNSG